MVEEEEQPLVNALADVDTTTLPPVSRSMADVSVRLTALEDTVAELKKKVEQLSLPPGETTTRGLQYANFFPSEATASKQAGGKKSRTRRATGRKQKKSRRSSRNGSS
jgi:hypothetical protein